MAEGAPKRRRIHPALQSANDELERLEAENSSLTSEIASVKLDLVRLKKINAEQQSEIIRNNAKLRKIHGEHQIHLDEKDDIIEHLQERLEAAEAEKKLVDDFRARNELLEARNEMLENRIESMERQKEVSNSLGK